ncbi:hypothetical protein [Klebsiella pneumoniae]|uniref:hypothetical protein n=1 Tax=Klebsiella pneumoniae complex TaxID=3390273 RepID=UPI001090DBBC|nr:hypothetical protein [Klebsiella pneumoniae]
MNLHDRLRIVLASARQFWRAFSYLMQVHENHYTKRAGVAGIRARAQRLTLDPKSLQAKKLTFIFQSDLSAKK